MGGWSRDFLEWKLLCTSGCVDIAKLVSMNKVTTIIMPKDALHVKMDASKRHKVPKLSFAMALWRIEMSLKPTCKLKRINDIQTAEVKL
jgi:hypothetical protein